MSWLVSAVLILLLALALQLGMLAFAMYALLVTIFVSRFLARQWIENIEVTRKCSCTTAQLGDLVTVVVTVRNTGKWPIVWLLVEDLLPRRALIFRPPDLDVRGQREFIATLRAGQSKNILYQFRCQRRGYYQVGPTLIETGDVFGLHRRYRVEASPEFVTVFPQPQALDGYEIASRRPIGEIRMSHRLYEDPTRNAGVRPYINGDPLSRVHWRASARTGSLQCKIYEPSCVAGATLLVDFHTASFDRRHEPVRSELTVTATASIANALYELNQQVGMISNGRDAIDRIRTEGWTLPPQSRTKVRNATQMRDASQRLEPVVVPTRRGAASRLLIIESLARLELTDGMTLPQLLIETNSRMPRDATVIVVLPKVTEQSSIALGNLVSTGFAVTAVINTHEPLDFADASGPLLAQGIATHHLVDERSIVQICHRLTMQGNRT